MFCSDALKHWKITLVKALVGSYVKFPRFLPTLRSSMNSKQLCEALLLAGNVAVRTVQSSFIWALNVVDLNVAEEQFKRTEYVSDNST